MSEIIEKNEMFDLAFRFATETKENIFLTGKAGTGKTTFLKYLKGNCAKNIIVAAPTGVASINAGGVTLHSLFQLPFYPFLPTKQGKEELLKQLKFNASRLQLLRKMELLVIDEISMVRCDVMDAIDTILRSVKRVYDQPFGGVQLLCIGDLYQLPPVARHQEWGLLQEFYESPFFFDSLAIKEQLPLLIELDKIYRQKEDSFVRLLNKVRNNQMDEDDYEDLLLRYNPNFRPEEEDKFITLTSHNKQADEINAKALTGILRPSYKYAAEVEGDFAEHLYPADFQLELKVGAQVMFLKNDVTQKRYFNGKIAVVKRLEKEEVIVDCDDLEIYVGKEVWENNKYVLNKETGKLEEDVLGSFLQYPLRLAWAITIHKSQGLTFDRVMIDAAAAFSSGQVYVALSRCTSLGGIVLLSKISPTSLHSNQSVIDGQQKLAHKGSLAERFAGARSIYILQILESIFDFSEDLLSIQNLSAAIKSQQQKIIIENNAENLSDKNSEILAQLSQDKMHGYNLVRQLFSLSKLEPVIENNSDLQKRISNAAQYFLPRFQQYLRAVEKNYLSTEFKETATLLNELLKDAYLNLHSKTYQLNFSKEPFQLNNWLQSSLQYVEPKIKLNIYGSGKENADGDQSELLDTLKRWRNLVCEENETPIYMVANQKTLTEIASYLPTTKKDLMMISGFGKAKADKFGEEILEIVQDYCDRLGLESNMEAAKETPKAIKKEKKEAKANKPVSRDVSFELLNKGYTVDQITSERNLVVGTIYSHLSYFVNKGLLSLDKFMDAEKVKAIKNAINKVGNNIPEIMSALPKGFTYDDIRVVRDSQVDV